jgi:peptidoglycan LD-endopeptidase LytH
MVLSAVCFLAPMVSSGVGRADDTDAQKAAKQIADARDRAAAAADAAFASESRIDALTLEGNQLQSEITQLEGEVGKLQQSVENVAVDRYTRSGSTGVPLLTGFSDPGEQVRIDALLNVVYDTSANDFDRLDALGVSLADKRRRLTEKKADAEKERANLLTLQDATTAEVERLKVLESQRLKDDGVRVALIAEEARRKRDADRKKLLSAPTPTAPASDATAAPGSPAAAPGSPAALLGAAAAAPGSATRPVSPDAAGGQTGGGGIGSLGGGGGGNDYGSGAWVCPTGTASVGFSDTWGAPRSGGRRHEGVDMIGSRGTPLLAVVDGVASSGSNVLGGITVSIVGNDGNRYYYAHLDSVLNMGSVTAGTPIGVVGQTGNAQFSVPHLHFEIHPGGGPAVNPYPTVYAHCQR